MKKEPYVNWGRYTNDVINAPLFDGSDTSISGNGVYQEHIPIALTTPKAGGINMTIPPSVGGGCVHNGPFANYTINIGPLGINDSKANPLSSGLGYNPRCMRRDLNLQAAQGARDINSTKLFLHDDILNFQNFMQEPFSEGVTEYGVHTAGHFTVGGDPGGDLYTSPGDPYFWLHHSQIDRMWWTWQNLDLENRGMSVAGTITGHDVPPSRNTTLDDVITLGVLDGFDGMTIRNAMSTMGGDFCYIYV